ncbi:Chl4 protein [Pichia kluyveri]|uniref:Chl4 protein n=1 Tax=Pichia kluyveri TaxID=36015 RepID=A0AAV5QZW2_PICKL|nr:Chl4 protein [Pichia kluyveri]
MPPKKRKITNSGILSNSYIPPLRASEIERELQKLPANSLFSLSQLWLTISITQPSLSNRDKEDGYTRQSLSEQYLKELEKLKEIKSKAQLKKKLVNLILVKFYPNGLNTLQLAQIDVQLLVDKPNVNAWVSSTAKIVNSVDKIPKENIDDLKDQTRNNIINELPNFTFKLNSQLFLENFITSLSNLYLTHVYISRHPYFPLLLIRVQMYDYSNPLKTNVKSKNLLADLTNVTLDRTAKMEFENSFQNILNNRYKQNYSVGKKKDTSLQRQIKIQNKPQIRSHRPFYILLPISSPHIIHSPALPEDLSSKLILQTLESTLSHSYHQKDKDQKKVNKDQTTKRTNFSSTSSNIKIMIFRDADIVNPIRNLSTVFTIKGISRFASALGAWGPYAQNIVDIGVFEKENNHLIINPDSFIELVDTDENDDDHIKERKIVAGLRFKGSLTKMNSNGVMNVNGRPGNAGNGSVVILDSDDDDEVDDVNKSNERLGFLEQEKERLKDPYTSLVPIHENNFYIEGDLSEFMNKRRNKKVQIKDQKIKVGMTLLGNDIFGGLHELAARGDLDPYSMPYWLTGESGTVGGKVIDSKLVKHV